MAEHATPQPPPKSCTGHQLSTRRHPRPSEPTSRRPLLLFGAAQPEGLSGIANTGEGKRSL